MKHGAKRNLSLAAKGILALMILSLVATMAFATCRVEVDGGQSGWEIELQGEYFDSQTDTPATTADFGYEEGVPPGIWDALGIPPENRIVVRTYFDRGSCYSKNPADTMEITIPAGAFPAPGEYEIFLVPGMIDPESAARAESRIVTFDGSNDVTASFSYSLQMLATSTRTTQYNIGNFTIALAKKSGGAATGRHVGDMAHLYGWCTPEGGTLTPPGTINVPKGQDFTYTVDLEPGWYVSKIVAEGETYTGNLNPSYTFKNLQSAGAVYFYLEQGTPPAAENPNTGR